MANPSILVLGVGNILLSDEGVGVHCINRLEQNYSFPDNVRLLDGGTLGMRLLPPISRASHLIVIDAAIGGHPPGTITKLTFDEIRAKMNAKYSLHQLDFSETLLLAETMGHLPQTVIIAIEPKDMTTLGTTLTPLLTGKLDALCEKVLDEIKAAGGSFGERQTVKE